jgi:hypothetical protein
MLRLSTLALCLFFSLAYGLASETFDADCIIKLDNEMVFEGVCSVYKDMEQIILYDGNVVYGKLAYIPKNGQADVALKKVYLPSRAQQNQPALARNPSVISDQVGKLIKKGNCYINPRVQICFKSKGG